MSRILVPPVFGLWKKTTMPPFRKEGSFLFLILSWKDEFLEEANESLRCKEAFASDATAVLLSVDCLFQKTSEMTII